MQSRVGPSKRLVCVAEQEERRQENLLGGELPGHGHRHLQVQRPGSGLAGLLSWCAGPLSTRCRQGLWTELTHSLVGRGPVMESKFSGPTKGEDHLGVSELWKACGVNYPPMPQFVKGLLQRWL